MKTVVRLYTKYKNILFITLIAILVGLPLLHTGLMPTHDGEYHVIRFYEFYKALAAGNWYPVWAPDLNFGYGVPLFLFVYPLPNYFATLFHLFGIGFIDGLKLNMFVAGIIGGIFFYLWAKEWWTNLGALVGATFYTFSPYHFLDVYVRGSVGEVWALGLFPVFLWAITKTANERQKKYVVFSAVSLALIIFAHNILALMFFFFAISYAGFLFLQTKEKKTFFLQVVGIFLLGLGLSSIFWLPALVETKYVTGLQLFEIHNNFPDLFQLLIPSWGTGFDPNDLNNQMSFQIGVMNLLAIFASIILLPFVWKKKPVRFILLFFLGWFVLLFYLMLPVSQPVWNTLPLIHYFQFPWRLLSLMILVCSFVSGAIFSIKDSRILAAVIIFLAIITTYNYSKPAYYMMRSDNHYTTRSNFIDGTNSPGNAFNTIWMTLPKKHATKLVDTDGTIGKMTGTPTHFSFTINAKTNQTVTINTTYFPGWAVKVDDITTAIKQKNGLITFPIKQGIHTVIASFGLTFIQIIAQCISLLALVILLVKGLG
ncbi:MAG: 6-pyruvoyl-tetrahydropterin synthase-related protein [Candidatus Levyibacteriota bacterium]